MFDESYIGALIELAADAVESAANIELMLSKYMECDGFPPDTSISDRLKERAINLGLKVS